MISAATMRKLAALNLQPEQMAGVLEVIAEVMEAEEAKEAEREAKKARDARRKQAARRDRPRNVRGMSADNDGNVRGMSAECPTDTLPEVSPSFSPSTPSSITTSSYPTQEPTSVERAGLRDPGDVVPEDWVPSEADRMHAELAGVPADQVDRLAVEFREHSRANGRRYTSPSAGWRLWVSRQHRFETPTPRARSPATRFDESKSVVAAAQRLIDNGFQIPPRPQSVAERMGLIPSPSHGCVLPDGRRDGAGDVLRCDGRGVVRLPARDRREGDGPEVGNTSADEVSAKRGGSR